MMTGFIFTLIFIGVNGLQNGKPEGNTMEAHSSRRLHVLQSRDCVDVNPSGPLNCSDYVSEGLCNKLEIEYCQLSCFGCTNQTDVPQLPDYGSFPGFYDYETPSQFGDVTVGDGISTNLTGVALPSILGSYNVTAPALFVGDIAGPDADLSGDAPTGLVPTVPPTGPAPTVPPAVPAPTAPTAPSPTTSTASDPWTPVTVVLRGPNVGLSVGGAKGVENFRRSIEENFLPSLFDITYEGMFNEYYFDTKSKNNENECQQLFCADYSVAISKGPLEENPPMFDFYITVGMESNILLESFSRKALNFVVVLDISGSMGQSFILETNDDPQKIQNQFDSKLDIAKKAMGDLLQKLNNNDSLSIVTFSDYAETLIKLTPVGEVNLQDALNKISSIEESGGTNMEAAYKMASQILKQCQDCMFDKKYENRIIFLTDAQPNLGDTTAIGLASQVTQNAGIQIYTTFIGVGLDFNTELSEILTKSRGANYFVVNSPLEFSQKLVDEFDFMVTPLVFDLKLEIDAQSFNNGNGWRVVKVYGSPNLDGGLDKEGILVEVNTLFPSPKTIQGTKGGVVLLKMQKPQDSSIPLILKVSYKDRTTIETFESFSEVKLAQNELNYEYFDSTGAQKAVLLARYVDLLKGWLVDQHLTANNEDQIQNPPTLSATRVSTSVFQDQQQQIEQQQFSASVAVSMDLCEYYPEDRVTYTENQCQVQNFVQPNSEILPMFNSITQQNNHADWGKVYLDLLVSKQQGEAMEQFLIYLQNTIDELGDYSLEQEVGILTKLIDISKQN